MSGVIPTGIATTVGAAIVQGNCGLRCPDTPTLENHSRITRKHAVDRTARCASSQWFCATAVKAVTAGA